MNGFGNMRVSEKDKDKAQKQWYKDTIDFLDKKSSFSYDTKEWDRKRINYNLFNGIIDKKDFEYVYRPLGDDIGDLPADFSNKDIISSKIKVLLGMELERNFPWRVTAVNQDAISRKEDVKFNMIRDYVIQQIMTPIAQQVQMNYAQQMKGQTLSSDEQQQIQQSIQQEIQAKTPPEIDEYMKREHKDPLEILVSQLMEYGIKEQDILRKFHKGWKDATASAYEVYWVGILNDRPILKNINPLFFDCDTDGEADFIEEREWAGVEMWLPPSQVVQYFGDELTDEEIDGLYESVNNIDQSFTFQETYSENKIRVLHRAWRALRKLGFLTYVDLNTGELQLRIVDEDYKLNKKAGDVNIDWQWIPDVYEGYKIGTDKYVKLQPVYGQQKTLENLYYAPLPYYGGIYDNQNSMPTSLIDRMKIYQYYYDIIMYRIEMLMASDKGKLLLLNMNLIPNSSGIDFNKFLYYAEAMHIGFLDPNEEGNKNNASDVSTAAKEIDRSLVSDIAQYIKLAEYVEQKCGESVGVTKEMEGRIGQYQAVQTTQASLAQGNYIIEPYLDFHTIIERNALTAFMNMTIMAYANNDIYSLDYILDDFSKAIIKIDKDLLTLAQVGLFVGNSLEVNKIKETINSLSLTAMQNKMIDISTVVDVLMSDSIATAKEKLQVGEQKMQQQNLQMQTQSVQMQQELQTQKENFTREQWQHDKDMLMTKEIQDRETALKKQAIASLGFDKNKDYNHNGIPDVLEIANASLDNELKMRKQNLEEEKFKHQVKMDKTSGNKQ